MLEKIKIIVHICARNENGDIDFEIFYFGHSFQTAKYTSFKKKKKRNEQIPKTTRVIYFYLSEMRQ